jgi:hypothetical protein
VFLRQLVPYCSLCRFEKTGCCKEFLGHASLDNTLLYIQVDQAIFGLNNDDEFTVQAINDKEEMKKLLFVGFEYVCQKDDMLFFRKRK